MNATNAQRTTSGTDDVQNITTADVLKVYSGKPGCMCGCKGRYYVTAESRAEAGIDRGYAYDDKDVNAAQVLRVLRLVQAAVAGKPAKLEIEREYVYVEAGGRALAIYFRQRRPAMVCEGCEQRDPTCKTRSFGDHDHPVLCDGCYESTVQAEVEQAERAAGWDPTP